MVFDKINSKQCMLSAIYAPPQEIDKNNFLSHLKYLNNVIDIPWCLMGDFNEMLQISDKIGGAPLNTSKIRRCNDFLEYSKGWDADVQGRMFTWKKQLHGRLVYEKLDRVIFRDDCPHLFPNYLVTNGPFTCSDHAYVSLNTEPTHTPRRGTIFKYQHSWAQYQDTHYVVKQNWKTHILGTPMFRLVQKLKKIKLDLKTWSKRTFGNFKYKLKRNGEKLLQVEQKLILQSHSVHLNNWLYRLIKQREKMHLFNHK